jgi:hypothetical protein
VAAEETFRAIETSLEAMLYKGGVQKIEYPGGGKPFTGRLALQFLARDELVRKNAISRSDYKQYLSYAADLHQAGYRFGLFEESRLRKALAFAEGIFDKALALSG